MDAISKQDLIREINRLAHVRKRTIVAIAGPPGSGKTTLAKELAAELNVKSAVLPMDGFHFDNEQLREMKLLHRKGAPETFDAVGFVDLIQLARQGGALRFPTFDRTLDATVPDTGLITSDTSVVLVEGNYLLLKTSPWNQLREAFNLTVLLDVSQQELETRLIDRWLKHGFTLNESRDRALANDIPNALFVLEQSTTPDFVLGTGPSPASRQ
ncbi:AAA family ATPase [Shimia abyssi]|uniref:Pantothenate kinase n=1 Tax=Shimia abyssi TaxID=1662395 RepID=A0A2P8F1W7_9RHOB|nr:AAA family ATPase [Shimia abyssi]PSL15711.1 pantothenate kinase [Shimia abyssi]